MEQLLPSTCCYARDDLPNLQLHPSCSLPSASDTAVTRAGRRSGSLSWEGAQYKAFGTDITLPGTLTSLECRVEPARRAFTLFYCFARYTDSAAVHILDVARYLRTTSLHFFANIVSMVTSTEDHRGVSLIILSTSEMGVKPICYDHFQ
jgi:hypothetical protein